MTTAHTPGPWQYGHVGTEAFWIGPSWEALPVAHVDHDMEYARDNSRENARLIAAAPDLFALVLQYRDDLRHPPAPNSVTRRLEAVNAAIAKATAA